MKKSEARNLIGHVIERTFDPAPDGIEIILNAWEEAGVQWEPEEVEFPKRVEVRGPIPGLMSRPFLGVKDRSDSTEIAWKITREAAARYNAVNRCYHEGRFHEFFSVLEEERERLQ